MAPFGIDPAPAGEEPAAKPRKTGFKRMLEILSRDTGRLFVCGLITFAGCLPAMAAGVVLIIARQYALLVLALTVCGPLCAMMQCGMFDTVLRSLRDEPNFWWHTYRKAWKNNYKHCVAPGLLFGLLYGGLAAAAAYLMAGRTEPAGTFPVVMLLLAGLLITALHTLTIAQIALVELPLKSILKNSILLTVPYFGRVMLSALLQCISWGLMILSFPLSITVALLLGFWVNAALALTPIYAKPLNQAFRIEERLKEAGSPSDALNHIQDPA